MQAGQGVLQPPLLLLDGRAVSRGVVRRRVRAHAVGHRLDQCRTQPGVGAGQGDAGGRQHRQHVVAVDLNARDAVALPPLRDGGVRLQPHRLGDGPLVVLAEEDDRDHEAGGETEGLGHVPLAAGAVAEIGQRRRRGAVQRHAQGVPGGVQGLRAHDDGRRGDAVLGRVPTGERRAAPHAQHGDRVDAAAVDHAVLAVAREGEVVRAQGAGRSHLGRLLPEQRGPQAELALALQRHRLGVDAPDDGHVGVEVA